MQKFSLLCVMLMAVSLTFAQTPAAKSLSPFEQELVNNQKQFIAAQQEKNVAYVAQAVADDFKGIGENGDFYEKSELVGGVREGLPKDFRMYDIEVVRLDESCAVVTYNEIVPGTRPRYRHMSNTWVKDGSKWKLKFEQLTANLWSAHDLD
jgi:hypothetical protein